MTTAYGNPDAPIVLIQLVDDHDHAGIETEVAEIQKLAGADFCLIAMKVQNWNADLSPWPAPAVFGKEGFDGRADDTLKQVLHQTADKQKTYIIGGYSLAGLFALWAACQTDQFFAVAAASPSVWFPGFAAYMRQNVIRTSSVYLSLGDKEEKTRNPVIGTVGDRIREVYDDLRRKGINTILEWNQGNHFRDADIRTAKAFAWGINIRKGKS